MIEQEKIKEGVCVCFPIRARFTDMLDERGLKTVEPYETCVRTADGMLVRLHSHGTLLWIVNDISDDRVSLTLTAGDARLTVTKDYLASYGRIYIRREEDGDKEPLHEHDGNTTDGNAGRNGDEGCRRDLDRAISNAEDVATARQVLTGIAEWMKSGRVWPLKEEPFCDVWLNGVVSHIWDCMINGHYEMNPVERVDIRAASIVERIKAMCHGQ